MKADGLLISAEELPWRNRFPFTDHSYISDLAISPSTQQLFASNLALFDRHTCEPRCNRNHFDSLRRKDENVVS
jgi:hypothetical protein